MAESKSDRKTSEFVTISDDMILRFHAERARTTGRLVRLGPLVNKILSGHNYPGLVSSLLGEAVALTALLGASLKFNGKLILQTKSDGPINFLVVQYSSPGNLRGYAGFDDEAVRKLGDSGPVLSALLLGSGHLAMTIDNGADKDRYQGVVALEGNTLSEVAQSYFRNSEQLPTFLRLAVARHYSGGENQEAQWSWRAGGLMIQNLSSEGGFSRENVEDDEEDNWPFVEDDEGWNRACHLAATVEDHELLDPVLSPERLLYRLFHEERIRTYKPKFLTSECQCSRSRVESMLQGFSPMELEDMVVNGKISVVCEFCSHSYDLEESKFG